MYPAIRTKTIHASNIDNCSGKSTVEINLDDARNTDDCEDKGMTGLNLNDNLQEPQDVAYAGFHDAVPQTIQ